MLVQNGLVEKMNKEKRERKNLDLEKRVREMDPKRKGVFLNIISVIIICIVLYGFGTFVFSYLQTHNFLAWFSSSDFMVTVVVLILVYFVYLFLSGKLKMKDNTEEKKKVEFNIPNYYAKKPTVQKEKDFPNPLGQKDTHINVPNTIGMQRTNGTKLNIPDNLSRAREVADRVKLEKKVNFNPPNIWKQQVSGTWICPHCGNIAVGNECQHCGYWRRF